MIGFHKDSSKLDALSQQELLDRKRDSKRMQSEPQELKSDIFKKKKAYENISPLKLSAEQKISEENIKKQSNIKMKADVPSKTTVFGDENISDEQEELLEIPDNYRGRVMVSSWFITVCCLQIPLIGFIYLLILCFKRKGVEPSKKAFARAYLLYRVLVWILALSLLFVLYRTGLNILDGLLSYVN